MNSPAARTMPAAVAAGIYVALTMFTYGLSESFATHRVAIMFGPETILRLCLTAATLGFFAFAAGLLATRLQHWRPRVAPTVLLSIALVSSAGYFFLEQRGKAILALLCAMTCVVLWRFARGEDVGAGWLAFTPFTFVTVFALVQHFPSIANIWLFGMAWSVVIAATLAAHAEMRDWSGTRAAVAMAVLVALAFAVAVASPWPMATHYPPVKIFGTATCAFAGASLIWLLYPARKHSRLTMLGAALLLAGLVGHCIFLSQGRRAAYGVFTVDTMVGKSVLPLYPVRAAGELERQRLADNPRMAVACPAGPKPKGVLWVVVDALRADSFTPAKYPGLKRFADHATSFSNAYAPAHSTFSAFGTWFPRLPDEGGVPWSVLNVGHLRAQLEIVLGEQIPVLEAGDSCTGEGERIGELADGLAPGTLALAYFPITHDPYYCTAPGQAPRQCYDQAIDCVAKQLDDVYEWAYRNPDWAVVITSDHGESFHEKNVRYHAIALWEEAVRVPLIVRAPGWTAGKKVETAVSNAWLSGTVGCWLADDSRAFGAADGVLTDSPVPQPFAIQGFSVYFGTAFWAIRETAVIDWPHKLIVDRDTDYAQLFDLKADPGEEHNLSDSQPQRSSELRETLDRLWGPPLTNR